MSRRSDSCGKSRWQKNWDAGLFGHECSRIVTNFSGMRVDVHIHEFVMNHFKCRKMSHLFVFFSYNLVMEWILFIFVPLKYINLVLRQWEH